jgi:hypothetical protein
MKTSLRKTMIFGLASSLLVLLPAIGLALTPEQVIALKKAGVSDATIQLMIQQEENARKAPEDTIGRREIKDSQGNTVIIYSTGNPPGNDKRDEEKKKLENAWKMLQNMNIKVDSRSMANPQPAPKAETTSSSTK